MDLLQFINAKDEIDIALCCDAYHCSSLIQNADREKTRLYTDEILKKLGIK